MACGSVWGRIAPPPDEEFVGGGLFCAFEDNDGDSDQGFKAGMLDVTMLARWRYDESVAGQGLCSLAGAMTVGGGSDSSARSPARRGVGSKADCGAR